MTCSTDRSVRLYKVPFAPLEAGAVEKDVSAVLEFHGKFGFRSLDHHWRDNTFATAGDKVPAKRSARPCSKHRVQLSMLSGLKARRNAG